MLALHRLPVKRSVRRTWIVASLILLFVGSVAGGTPLYSARAGRTCDNCHLRPNLWTNPRRLDRKCTLSCRGCHVDPAGGGMRNAVGRFYGRATLPMIATSPRPTQDWDRWIGGWLYRRDHATTFTDSLPEGPPDFAAAHDVGYAPRDRWAGGHPWGSPSVWALFPGREGILASDPAVQVSWDLRYAALVTQGSLVFPMQADLGFAVHPVEHLILVANIGARGRSAGFSETADDPHTPYLRDGYALVHELPAMAYVRAGRFMPAFGLRLDDHTTQPRRAFEQDGSVPESRVTGVEVGANPSYPYVSLAWFRSDSRTELPPAFDLFERYGGEGFAVNAGYRELGWSLGGSLLSHSRELADGGDATSVAFSGVFNPWFYNSRLPLTYQAEFDHGRYQRASGRSTERSGFYQELDWRAGNGVNLLATQDWVDPDREVDDDHAFRVGAGIQITPLPGITFDLRARGLFPAGGGAAADGFAHVHLWR